MEKCEQEVRQKSLLQQQQLTSISPQMLLLLSLLPLFAFPLTSATLTAPPPAADDGNIVRSGVGGISSSLGIDDGGESVPILP